MNPLDIISAVLGLTCVVLAGRNSKYNFWVGYLYTAALFLLFWNKNLYASLLLQPVSLAINVLGHWRWTHPKPQEQSADGGRNYSQCDSLLIGKDCGAHTFPLIQSQNPTAIVEHEATTSKISEDQLFYCNQRGIGPEEAVGLIVNGYAREVLSRLPMEFAVEARKLLQVSLEGSVG